MNRPNRRTWLALVALAVTAAMALLATDLHAHSGLETQATCGTCAVKSHFPGVLNTGTPGPDPQRVETPVETAPVAEPEPVTVTPSRSRAPPEA